jgi:hypothetical protein
MSDGLSDFGDGGYYSPGEDDEVRNSLRTPTRDPEPASAEEPESLRKMIEAIQSSSSSPHHVGSAASASHAPDDAQSSFWEAPLMSFFKAVREALGDARPLRLASACTGLFSEGAALEVRGIAFACFGDSSHLI